MRVSSTRSASSRAPARSSYVPHPSRLRGEIPTLPSTPALADTRNPRVARYDDRCCVTPSPTNEFGVRRSSASQTPFGSLSVTMDSERWDTHAHIVVAADRRIDGAVAGPETDALMQ